MRRSRNRVACALLASACVLAAPPVRGQSFPAPGEGVYTWEQVGDRRIRADALDFDADGAAYATDVLDSLYVLDPGPQGAPAGWWRALGNIRSVYALLVLNADTMLTGRLNGGILSRSVDGGQNWADVNGCSSGCPTGGPRRPGGFLVLPPGHAHAGRVLAGGGPTFSDDRGATWTAATNDGLLNKAYAFALMPSGRVLAAFAGVYASDDGGASYAGTALRDASLNEGVAALATPGSTQSAEASGGTPSCGLADTSLCDGAVTLGSGPGGIVAWRTSDGGRSWSAPVPLPQPRDGIGADLAAGVVALPPGPGGLGRAVAVLGRGLVYATSDGAQSWQAVGRLPLDLITGAQLAWYVRLGPDGHLWVLSKRAGPSLYPMYRSAEPAEVAFPVASEAPPETAAPRLRVVPNPTSGRVSVRLTLDATSEARISVVDALGRRVAVLHDGPLAGGEQSFAFDTSALPAGVYVVRLEAGGVRASARVSVVR